MRIQREFEYAVYVPVVTMQFYRFYCACLHDIKLLQLHALRIKYMCAVDRLNFINLTKLNGGKNLKIRFVMKFVYHLSCSLPLSH